MKEYKLENLKEGEILALITGKVLKVFIEFENKDGLTNLQMWSKEGEQILNIDNLREKDIFYPRVNIIRGRYSKQEVLNHEGLTNLDYYYSIGFLIKVISKSQNSETLIKKLIVLYE